MRSLTKMKADQAEHLRISSDCNGAQAMKALLSKHHQHRFGAAALTFHKEISLQVNEVTGRLEKKSSSNTNGNGY